TTPRPAGAAAEAMRLLVPIALGALLAAACSDDEQPAPAVTQAAGGTTATATSGGGSAPSTGGGGTAPCGGCDGNTPHCMGTECVGCLNHSHCTEPGAAKCDATTNECVPCDAGDADVAQQCAGIPNAAICDEGT